MIFYCKIDLMKQYSQFIFVLFVVVLMPAVSHADEKHLFVLIQERLSYMEDVAVYKAQHDLPIEDKKREAIVLEKTTNAATEVGLSPEKTIAFFKAQIALAKAIQYRLRADMLSDNTPREARDLKTIIRPKLIQLGKQITIGIANHLKAHGQFSQKDEKEFYRIIDVRYITEKEKTLLFHALKKIELSKN
ncbi:gamma subclass chorismate mutase AroQ [Algicola sagamiensis]|uniref:gamma subclass chorismate mutase AroQ n=1 Tax=Algicola sagamiensis TaxID=163869 RepID=UPI00036DCB84|nr:gamma subclass chorismate mutase AroQ [Algicola sagamiensis]